MKKRVKKVLIHLGAALLGFLPIAIFPFDDPLLLGGIALARKVGGLWGGWLVFNLCWLGLGIIAFLVYERIAGEIVEATLSRGVMWARSQMDRFGGVFADEAEPEFSWRTRLSWLRWQAHQWGADTTFIYVLCGPLFSVFFLYHWGYRGWSVVARLVWATVLAGTIWYLWYAGVIWTLVNALIRIWR